LPSINLIYSPAERSRLRFSVSQTVARPSFKEKSIAQIQDRISNRTFLGNIALQQSTIGNVDLRFEKYFEKADQFTAAVFYKKFNDPIQLVVFDSISPNNFQPKNTDDTNVYGFEMEVSKNLSFISSSLNNFSFSSNFSVVKSEMPLIGLAPFMINGNLGYANEIFEANIIYNVQGKRLSVVGAGRIEDVYELPFQSLNLRLNRKFGKEKRNNLSFTVDNILGSQRKRTYDTRDNSLQIFDNFQPGTSFGLSYGYTIK
jgi:outer membrane receptor protein involved in Fe transport